MTTFCSAIERKRSIASCSGTAAGRSSGSVVRIESGTVWSSSCVGVRHTERVEHVGHVGRGRADVTTDEFGGLEQFGDGRGHAGLQVMVGPRCHRYLRV